MTPAPRREAHTPELWEISDADPMRIQCVGRGEEIASLHGSYEKSRDERHANARLIAAAPALLEALQEMVDLATPNIYPQPDKPNSAWAKLLRARAALRQASGGADAG